MEFNFLHTVHFHVSITTVANNNTNCCIVIPGNASLFLHLNDGLTVMRRKTGDASQANTSKIWQSLSTWRHKHKCSWYSYYKKKFIWAPLVSPIVVIKSPSINYFVSLFTHATFCQSEYEVMQKKKAEEFWNRSCEFTGSGIVDFGHEVHTSV